GGALATGRSRPGAPCQAETRQSTPKRAGHTASCLPRGKGPFPWRRGPPRWVFCRSGTIGAPAQQWPLLRTGPSPRNSTFVLFGGAGPERRLFVRLGQVQPARPQLVEECCRGRIAACFAHRAARAEHYPVEQLALMLGQRTSKLPQLVDERRHLALVETEQGRREPRRGLTLAHRTSRLCRRADAGLRDARMGRGKLVDHASALRPP